MKNLKITVEGAPKTGKSRITYLLKEFLREQGFNVEFINDIDHPTEEAFNRSMQRNLTNATSAIKQTSNITLKEVRTT